MNTFFTQLKEKARTIKLSRDEKQVMRVQLYTYLEKNPAGSFNAPHAIPKPMPSPFFFFSPRYMVPVVLLLMVSLGTGTAFAAQSALPGNPLYAIKVHVNEPVQVALATTPAAKAQVNAAIATTRLEEAEALAAGGMLDATTTAQLASNFTAHAEAAQAVMQTISASDPGTAAQLGAEFNSSLAAHGAILAEIGQDSKSGETMQNSDSLAMAVQQEANTGTNEDAAASAGTSTLAIAGSGSPQATAPSAVVTPAYNGARRHMFAAAAPASSATGTATSTGTTSVSVRAKGSPAVTASLNAEASTTIAAAEQGFAAIQPSLDATTSSQILAQLAAAQTEYVQGDFAAAIRTAIKLDIYFKAGKNINLKLLSELLTGQGGTQDEKTPGHSQPMQPVTPAPPPAETGTSSTASSSSSDGSVNMNVSL